MDSAEIRELFGATLRAVLSGQTGQYGHRNFWPITGKINPTRTEAEKALNISYSSAPKEGEVQERIKKAIYTLMTLLVLYVVVRSVVAAARTPFMFDETVTEIVSSLPSARAIWQALHHNLDSQPLLFYLCERTAASAISNKQIGLRILSVLAFPCTLICVFLYVKRRSGEIVGFLCAALLLSTSLFHIYGIDARAYSMVMACTTFALLCYERLPSLRWAILFGLSLLLAELLHYYAIFSFVPFGLAETVVFFRTRRFRLQVWIPLLVSALPLAICWPLLARLRAYYGPHIFTHYSIASIPVTYGTFFLTSGAIGGTVVAMSLAALVFFPLGRHANSPQGEKNSENIIDKTLILTMMAAPLIVYIATSIMHGAMVERYVLVAIIGVSLAMGLVLTNAAREFIALFAVLVFSIVGLHEYTFWRSSWRHPLSLDSPAPSAEKFIREAGHPDLPIAVSNGDTFVWLNRYASPSFADRLVCLTDEQNALNYLGTDSMDKNLLVLRAYTHFRVVDFSDFRSTHRQFLLYSEEPLATFDWLTLHLSHTASMRILAMEQSRRLYLVTMDSDTASDGSPNQLLN